MERLDKDDEELMRIRKRLAKTEKWIQSESIPKKLSSSFIKPAKPVKSEGFIFCSGQSLTAITDDDILLPQSASITSPRKTTTIIEPKLIQPILKKEPLVTGSPKINESSQKIKREKKIEIELLEKGKKYEERKEQLKAKYEEQKVCVTSSVNTNC